MQRLKLPESLDIGADAFLDEARAKILRDPLTIDGSAVSRIDAAGLQALHAVVAAARAGKVCVSWEKPSRVLVDAATTLGLAAALELADS